MAIAEEGLVEPLAVIGFSKQGSQIRQIMQICQVEKVSKIVVGIAEGKSGEKAKKFGWELARITGVPVEFADETLTTHDAFVIMKTVSRKWKNKPDAIAAAFILKNYFKI